MLDQRFDGIVKHWGTADSARAVRESSGPGWLTLRLERSGTVLARATVRRFSNSSGVPLVCFEDPATRSYVSVTPHPPAVTALLVALGVREK